jgi:hypothetical protein
MSKEAKNKFVMDILIQMKNMDYLCVKKCSNLDHGELARVEEDCLSNCKGLQQKLVEEYVALFDTNTLNLKG